MRLQCIMHAWTVPPWPALTVHQGCLIGQWPMVMNLPFLSSVPVLWSIVWHVGLLSCIPFINRAQPLAYYHAFAIHHACLNSDILSLTFDSFSMFGNAYCHVILHFIMPVLTVIDLFSCTCIFNFAWRVAKYRALATQIQAWTVICCHVCDVLRITK